MNLEEPLISLAEAADLLPRRGGRKVSTTSLWRWCDRGIQGIQLEHTRVGGGIFTSKGSLEKFLAAVTAHGPIRRRGRRVPSAPTTRRRNSRQRAADHARAKKRLENAGI